MGTEEKTAEEKYRFFPVSRSANVEGIYATPVYIRDCSSLLDLENGSIAADECVVEPWRRFFLIWEGYPPYGSFEHERVLRVAAKDAVRVVAAHYGMRAYTFILNTVALNVFPVDDHFWEEAVIKRNLCFARYADGRVLIPGQLPIVDTSGPNFEQHLRQDLEWYLEQDRQYIASLKNADSLTPEDVSKV